MKTPLRVLAIASEGDCRTALGELERAGFALESRCAAAKAEIEQALTAEWDVILCDLAVPDIDCRDILRMMDERGCKTPVVALAQEADEAKIREIIELGACDCLSKTDFSRLTAVIRREMRYAAELRAQKLAMSESETRFSMFMDNLPGPANIKQEDGTFVYVNKAACDLMGGAHDQIVGRKYTEVSHVSDETAKTVENSERRMISSGQAIEEEIEYEFDGQKVTYLTVKFPIPRVGLPTLIGTVLLDITERKQAEKQVSHLASFPEWNPNPNVEFDLSGAITYFNQAAADILKQTDLEDARAFFPVDLAEILSTMGPDRPGPVLREVAIKDRVIEENIRFVPGSDRVRIYGRDITLRKRGEESLRKLFRALKMLSECNQTLVHAGEEQRLLQDICRLVVEAGGYRMAWVGYAEHDAEKRIRPVAQYGFEEGYLESARITWEDTERGRGPTGTAVRTGEIQINHDFSTNPSMGPWLELARKHGFQSSIALPLTKDDSAFGVLTIYSAQPDAFDAEETALLAELAMDMAFGISAVRERIERRRAEEEVRRANAYNRSLLEATLDPLVTIDVDGKIMDVNKATETVTGYSRNQLIGSDFCDYFTDPQKARDGYKQVFEDGLVNDYPLEIQHRDGHITPVLYNAVVYRDDRGAVAGVFAAARDITELKRAEEARDKERRQFNDILEKLPAYLILLTPDYHVSFANRFFRERFGASGGRKCYEYLFERTEPCENCETYEVLKTNAPKEWEWLGPDGRNYYIYDFPFADVDGSPLILEMGIDITERKRAEAEIIKAKEEWERTFDAITDPVMIVDTNHRIVKANRAMAAKIHVSPYQAPGLRCCEAVHGCAMPPEFCPHAKLLTDGLAHTQEIHEERLDGDFLISVSPLFSLEGTLLGSVHYARDITQRRKAQRQLEEALQQLKAESELLERKNIALAEILNQIEREKTVLKTSIAANLELSILPALMRLEANSNPRLRKQLERIRQDLSDATSPFLVGLKSEFDNLSPRELEICRMIKAGMTSKEIAENLQLSLLTVQKFRELIRKKLNLTNSDTNLGTFLQSRTRTLL